MAADLTPLGDQPAPVAAHIRLLLWAMSVLTLFIVGLLIWQVADTEPTRWCLLADANGKNTSCAMNVLMGLIGIKDRLILGLLAILGVIVISFDVVLFGVRIKATGPGSLGIDLGADGIHAPGAHIDAPGAEIRG